ncbi:hypothetical protein J4G57_05215 [Aeromonas caviae]|uniref:hypothetical protein n=1 Tax=Aeromonas TaxID=642 RepID=UPI000F77AC4A|nr:MULTISPECIES: hypothetical protein [Aeromonas]MBS4707292.1 hypothetical protein [Aeromonas caviae]RSM32309.1 hypothetical protein C5B78_01085 [Aeromonas salmonicida]
MIKVTKTPIGFDVYMDTGDDGRLRVWYKEKHLNTDTLEEIIVYPDLTNIEFSGKARTAYNMDADAFPLSLVKGDQAKERGAFYINFSHTLTAQFRAENRPRKFQFDLQTIDASGWTNTFCKGTINFDQDNTY